MHGEDPESILHLCTAEKIHKFQAGIVREHLTKTRKEDKEEK